jgi:uncharacterized membrane protein
MDRGSLIQPDDRYSHANTLPGSANLLLYAVSLVLACVYAAFFCWLSIQRYDAFLMHALDMGNMDQAVWNTLHGNLFHFTNMRAQLPKEAWGTTTRLSFHVEPILLPLSLVYLIHAAPETLIVVQVICVALGAPAACRLALRVTGSRGLAIVAPIAYLLAPSTEAATLYEFHPVTLAAPALLWAFVFLEERSYRPFVFFAVLAIACKEEIGLVVACMMLWHWWRGGPRFLALAVASASAAWSLIAIGWIVPHFASGPSAYWQRYIDATSGGESSTGAIGVLKYWLHHPERLWNTVVMWPKAAMLHRFFMSTGYLCLFSLPALAISAPSLAIILLSTDQHMYGGLGQYSAELVPIGVAAAIYGFTWLVSYGTTRGLSARSVTIALVALMALSAAANQRANGFTPFASGYSAPVISAHVQLGQRLLKLIPPGAPVSSMDQLNPHLGDRAKSYLFPDVGDAQYVALDVTTNVNPGQPIDQFRATTRLLQSRRWEVLAADDGYLILHRVNVLLPTVPAIPSAFYSFALAPDDGRPAIASFGRDLQLVGVEVERREQVNLRIPDTILITSWRVLRPLPASTRLRELTYFTSGHVQGNFTDRLTTEWLPMSAWRPGQVVRVRSVQISLVDTNRGSDSIRLDVDRSVAGGEAKSFAPLVVVMHNYTDYPVIGTTLEVARIPVTY